MGYHESALSENTREAYQRGWEDFLSFCDTHGLEAAPATERAVALYLSDCAEDLATSTLSQRMAAIQHAHDERGLESPTRSKAVQNVMKGIRRESGHTPERAPPLLTEHVKKMVDSLPGDGEPPSGTEAEAAWLRGKRDRALILTGFAGAFRRSELAALRMEHLDSRPDGLLVTVPESKTDQEGEGQLVAIRRIKESEYCPVSALKRWADVASIDDGPIFRGVPRSGYISRDAVTGRTVGNAVNRAAEAAACRVCVGVGWARGSSPRTEALSMEIYSTKIYGEVQAFPLLCYLDGLTERGFTITTGVIHVLICILD